MKRLIATDYEIRRGVPVSGRTSIPMERKPVRVGTLINEKLFLDTGGALVHHKTVFLEDQIHDWSWKDGRFSYYTRVAEGQADVVIAYAVEEVEMKPDEEAAGPRTQAKPKP